MDTKRKLTLSCLTLTLLSCLILSALCAGITGVLLIR